MTIDCDMNQGVAVCHFIHWWAKNTSHENIIHSPQMCDLQSEKEKNCFADFCELNTMSEYITTTKYSQLNINDNVHTLLLFIDTIF